MDLGGRQVDVHLRTAGELFKSQFSLPHKYGDNNVTYLIESLWRLNGITYIICTVLGLLKCSINASC